MTAPGRIRRALLLEPLLVLLNLLIVPLFYPLIFLCYLPLFLHRRVAILLASRDPTLGRILSGASAAFAAITPYSNPNFVIIPYFTFSQRISSRDQIVASVSQNVVTARDSRGALLFPEIQQRIVARYGYHFWSWVVASPFRVEDHVHYLYPQEPERVVKSEELKAKLQQLLELPFNSSLSPWEIFLVPNFVDDETPSSSSSSKSVVILRLHHCLAGGYAITNLLQRLSSKPWENFRRPPKASPPGPLSSVFSEWLKSVGILLTLPYRAFKLFLSGYPDRNGWTSKLVEANKNGGVRSYLVGEVRGSFPLQDLKSIKAHFGLANLSSVLFAIVGFAIKKGMDRDGVDAGDGDVVVPRRIHIGSPWPLPTHPNGLGNHSSFVILPIELHHPPRVEQTLAAIDSEYSSLRTSWRPLDFPYLIKWLSSLPLCLLAVGEGEGQVATTTATISNFPFPSTKIDLFGVEVERIGLYCMCSGNASFTTCLSYAGNLTFTTGGDSSVLKSKEDLDFRASALREAFNELLLQTKCRSRGEEENVME